MASSKRSGRSTRGAACADTAPTRQSAADDGYPQVIVLTTPVFFLRIGIEWWIGRKRGRDTYRLNDALNSIGLGVMSQLTGVFSALLTLGIYTLAFKALALWQLPTNAAWVALVDLLYQYWVPVWAKLHLYAEMAQDSWRASNWADRLRVGFKHPGRRPADVAAKWPKPAFDLQHVKRFDPPMTRGAQIAAAGVFALLLGATTLILWNAHRLTLTEQLASAVGVIALLCLVGWVSERPLRKAAPSVTTT